MKKALTIIGLLAVIAGCLAVLFRNFKPEEDDGYVSARERAIIKKFDQNGDGVLDKTERKAVDQALAARRKEEAKATAELIKQFDQDGDGRLNREEKQAAAKARMQDITKKFDRNGDGVLDAEEKLAAAEALGR